MYLFLIKVKKGVASISDFLLLRLCPFLVSLFFTLRLNNVQRFAKSLKMNHFTHS